MDDSCSFLTVFFSGVLTAVNLSLCAAGVEPLAVLDWSTATFGYSFLVLSEMPKKPPILFSALLNSVFSLTAGPVSAGFVWLLRAP